MASNGKSSISGDMMRALEKIQKLAKRRSAPAAMSNRASSSTKTMGNSQSKTELPIDPSLERLQQLCAQFSSTCVVCKAPLEVEIEAQFESWRAGSQTIPPKSQISSMQCIANAEHSTCAGCGKAPAFSADNIFTSLGVVNHCCDLGRLFGVWFLLSRFDEAQLQQPPQGSKKDVSKKLVKHTKSLSTPGVGYAAGYNDYMDLDIYDYGAGVMDGPWGARPPLPSMESDHEQRKQAQDRMVIETLKLLTPFLPSLSADAAQDLCMLRLSTLFDRITELIRNDSITDITERSELFTEVIAFAQALADRPGLANLLYTERSLKINNPGLRHLGIPKGSSSFVLDDSLESRASSFFANSTDTYRQAKTFLKLSEKPKGKYDTTDELSTGQGKDVGRICRGLVELYESLEKKLGGFASTPNGNTTLEDSWVQYATENRVTFTDDVLKNHRYHKEIAALTSSTKKGRMNTISREVATLTTSLPTGIFLKIAEKRSDVMKVLIVGSAGSPYAGGLFIFDLFLDAEYPTTPPKMSFVLNGNDSEAHSFNPNLHRGGGVCLSLLNTWSGAAAERWQPNKSTILAVLISIQAMILGAPIPWINEPGYEGQATTKPAQEHRLLMQTKTLKYAMIAWIENEFKNPMLTEAVWKDISQAYWKYNGTEALGIVREWAKENPALTNYDPLNPTGKKPRKKGKSKTAATAEPEPAPPSQPINLVEKMENLLGIKSEAPEDTSSSKIGGLMNRLKGKRKASDSEGALNIPHHLKKQKSETPSVSNKWVYTGGKTQKEVRAVCKEFGIGSKPTIKDTIAKLEDHVNNKGKSNQALVDKWGKFMIVEGEMTSNSGTDSGVPSGEGSAWGS